MNNKRKIKFIDKIDKLRAIYEDLVNLCDEERDALIMSGCPRSCYDKSEEIDSELADLYSVIINLEAIIND